MEVSFFINMLVATALAIIIGLERELSGHKGSIKTNILITLGACIFVSYEKLTGIVDDDRIAASIVTGVGFLCSGFIFKNGLSVTGLGTASTLWCSAAVGVLCAGGHIKEAVIATAFLFSLNVIISLIQPKIKPLKMFDDTKIDVVYTITVVCLKNIAEDISENLVKEISKYEDISIRTKKINDITEDKVRLILEINQEKENIENVEKIVKCVENSKEVFSKGYTKKEE